MTSLAPALLLLAATATAEAAEPVPDEAPDEELTAVHEAEAALLEAHPSAPLRLALRSLGPASPLRAGLHDALAFVEADEDPSLSAAIGTLPFPLEAVAGKYDIPVDYNERVAGYLAFFQGPGRKWFGKWLARAGRYAPGFREILKEHGVPEDLVYLAMIESGFSPQATSWARAAGPWQFIEPTGKTYGLRVDFWIDERRDPVKATHAAARFLKKLHGDFGHWYLAWAAYNAGPGRVKKGIQSEGTTDFWALAATRAFRPETQGYVPKLIAAALIAKHPEAFGFPPVERQEPLAFEVVELPDATDLAVIARCAGVKVEEVKALNPELRRWATPPVDRGQKPYALKLPPGTAARFAERFAQVKPSERFTFRAYKIQRGDTLGHVALAFGTEVEAIKRVNGIKDVRKLRLGQELIIPLPPGALPKKHRAAAVAVPAVAAAPAAPPAPVERVAPPADGVHVLAEGETLGHVALRYGCSVDDLKRWNRIRSVKKLQIGQRLRVKP